MGGENCYLWKVKRRERSGKLRSWFNISCFNLDNGTKHTNESKVRFEFRVQTETLKFLSIYSWLYERGTVCGSKGEGQYNDKRKK